MWIPLLSHFYKDQILSKGHSVFVDKSQTRFLFRWKPSHLGHKLSDISFREALIYAFYYRKNMIRETVNGAFHSGEMRDVLLSRKMIWHYYIYNFCLFKRLFLKSCLWNKWLLPHLLIKIFSEWNTGIFSFFFFLIWNIFSFT